MLSGGHLPRCDGDGGCASSPPGERGLTRILAVLGPTASGKSEISLNLAERAGMPVLSVDSMQVYRGMDIGTAKPSPAERARVAHYMIDLVEPETPYSAAEFQQAARKVIDSGEHDTVLIVGGSGLHFRSVVDPILFPPHDPLIRAEIERDENPVGLLLGADPAAGQTVDLANRRRVVRALEVLHLTGLTPSRRASLREHDEVRAYRPHYPFTAVGVDPGPRLEERIARRTESMRHAGLLDEVTRLNGRLGRTASGATGYRQLMAVVRGEISPEAGWDRVRQQTNQLARRQRTFFKRDPRIRWIPWEDSPDRRISVALAGLDL